MLSGSATGPTFQPGLDWHSVLDQLNNNALPPSAGYGRWGSYPAPDYGADSFDYTGLGETAP
jgi:hypothetical protein